MNHKAIDVGATALPQRRRPRRAGRTPSTTRSPLSSPAAARARQDGQGRSSTPSTRWTATACLSARSPLTPTAPSSWAPPLTRSAAWPSPCPSGTAASASSATSAPTPARTPPSVPTPSPRPRPLRLPPPRRSSPSRPARARVCTPSPWPSARWTAWAAASAPTSARPRP